MNKEVIVITGCSGRIGKVTIDRFSDAKFQLVGLDIVAPSFSAPHFEFIKTDLTDDESVQHAMNTIRHKYGSRISSVIHLAAYYNFTGGAWEMYEKITIHGTERLLNACKAFDTEQFLFSSTMLVHAPCAPSEKITEDSPLIMNWEYPRSKVYTEEIMRRHHEKIPVVMLRIAGCYDDGCHSIPISNQIQRIYEHQMESRVFPGDMTHGASFLHLDDLADALFLIVEKRKELPSETVFVVGEEETLSYDELQREISRLLDGSEFTTYRIPKSIAKVGAWLQNHLPFMKKTFIKPWMIDLADNNYTLDLSYIKKMLGWKPKRTLRNTLPVMIKSLKLDPVSWYKENNLEMPCHKKSGCCKK